MSNLKLHHKIFAAFYKPERPNLFGSCFYSEVGIILLKEVHLIEV